MKQCVFYEVLASRGLVLTDVQKNQFEQFFELLVSWNEKMNLTGITEVGEVYAKHFFDSLEPFLDLDMESVKSFCDVGTGAGFPGMPLAIAYPHIRFDLIDSLGKRIDFINHCVEVLGMTNVKGWHVRAEDFAVDKRESYDIVTSRAVARLNMLAELCAPLVALGGQFITLKGPAGHEELKEAGKGPERLGLVYKDVSESTIEAVGARINLYFEKVEKTPKKYPRPFGQIKKSPLV